MERIALLEEAYALVSQYTKTDAWRPGLVDLCVYNALVGMHEDDAEEEVSTYVWIKTPDECMQYIMDKNYIFDDLEYGFEQLYEAIREYLINNDLIVDADSIEEDEE